MRTLIVVMGPSGAGKSRIGSALAKELSVPMLEGDDFHTDEAREKMASGVALEDSDRTVWIDRLVTQIEAETAEQVVLACSALTHYVQRRLRNQVNRHPVFVLLDAPREVLAERMQQREGAFYAGCHWFHSQVRSVCEMRRQTQCNCGGCVRAPVYNSL